MSSCRVKENSRFEKIPSSAVERKINKNWRENENVQKLTEIVGKPSIELLVRKQPFVIDWQHILQCLGIELKVLNFRHVAF